MPDTTVVCLKGRQREFGRSLELAPRVLYIGRAAYQGGWRLPLSDWANPFRAQREGGAQAAVEKYAAWLATQHELLARLPELSGRVLGCWCAEGTACHGRHLAALANGGLRSVALPPAPFELPGRPRRIAVRPS